MVLYSSTVALDHMARVGVINLCVILLEVSEDSPSVPSISYRGKYYTISSEL